MDAQGLHADVIKTRDWSLWLHDTGVTELVGPGGHFVYLKPSQAKQVRALADFLANG